MIRCKYLIAVILIMLLAVPSIAKKVKTASNKDNILTDLRYHYTMDILKNWKIKTFKEKEEKPEVLRALLIQKNYRVNKEAKNLDADFTRPEIQIFARKDNITIEEFAELLKTDVKAHNSKDEIINQLNLLLSGEYIDMQTIEFGGEKAAQMFFKRRWERILQGDPEDPRYRHSGGRIVRDVIDVQEIYILNHNGNLIVIQACSEFEFYDTLKNEIFNIVSSIEFKEAVSLETDNK
ncbi:MAG: hypothetical protein J7K40_03580 [candidate division Zixibacteria bacterium]|nr:hypothetical protein [candidate division Zixibacteria bacterium]